ncbi:XrtA system polysaccharide chain length determinant [Acidisphaera rubrifaciens]|uniref:Lipopolysaccharide biosynthesis protein n=1 Tax=Acidisphaera rubrifaciens HS-AP3 TaxID=1231350 RepID=A0A0D6P4Q3_9PROT|nr:XrtA system polysaccharide chain length determinant [Acidisphaera rubrifaciens]GAN76740.1 lipopolysaccharide biosynthesis protein [Acidisphaera rubrifaciens HS-AP3]
MHTFLAQARRHAAAAWRYRWAGIAAAWLICAVGWAGVHFMPRTYEARAQLYVEQDAVLAPLLHGLAIDSSSLRDNDVLRRTLLSRPNLEQVIAQTDLRLQAEDPDEHERLIKRLADDIRVVPEAGDLFTIVYRNRDRQLAYEVVQHLVSLFVASVVANSREEMAKAMRFVEQEIASYESQLREAEKRRAEFRARYVDVFTADGGSRLEAARTSVRALRGTLADAIVNRDTLTLELATTPQTYTDTESGGGGGGGGGRLMEAERNLAALRLRLTDQHPDVIAARNLVAALQSGRMPQAGGRGGAGVITRSRTTPNPVYAQLKVRLVELESTITSLQRQLGDAVREQARLETVARDNPRLEAEYQNMDRDYTVLRHNYEELLVRREAMRIATAADTHASTTKLQVVDPPRIPRLPNGPRPVTLIAGVLLAGLIGGAGVAAGLGVVHDAYYTLDELQHAGVPVLGGISAAERPFSVQRVASLLAVSVMLLLLVSVCAGLLTQSWVFGPV